MTPDAPALRPPRPRLHVFRLPLSRRYQTVRNIAQSQGVSLGRHLVRDGRPKDGRLDWRLVRNEIVVLQKKLAERQRDKAIDRLIEQAQNAPIGRTAGGSSWHVNGANYALFAYFFTGNEVDCARYISGRETGGTYSHRVGYGFTWDQGDNGRAFGLGQALPGWKMAGWGSDWRTNPATQLRWFRDYAIGRYGSVCGAAAYHRANGVW